MVEISESTRLSAFALPFTARACHTRLARLTRARRQWFGRRTARVLLADFWYTPSRDAVQRWLRHPEPSSSSRKSTIKKVTICLNGGSKPPPYAQNPSIANRKSKKYVLYPVSAGTGVTPAPPIFQRACRQCVHESARLFRVICSHAW